MSVMAHVYKDIIIYLYSLIELVTFGFTVLSTHEGRGSCLFQVLLQTIPPFIEVWNKLSKYVPC